MAVNEFVRFDRCRHPHIIECFGMTLDEQQNWCLLLEYAANGDLNHFYDKFERNKYGNIREEELSQQLRFDLVD